MKLIDRISSDIAAAMRAKNQATLAPLRMAKAALMNREVEKGRPLDEAESQQVIAQQRQFFLLAQCAHAGVGERGRNMGEVHILNSSERSPRGGVESLDHQYCASQHEIQARIVRILP